MYEFSANDVLIHVDMSVKIRKTEQLLSLYINIFYKSRVDTGCF